MLKNSNPHSAHTSRRFLLALALVSTFGLTKNIWGQDNGLTPGATPTAPLATIPQNFKFLQEQLKNLRLVGKGNYTYWGFDVYSASLWASDNALKPIDWAEQRLALDLLYLRDFAGKDIAKRSIDEIFKQSPISEEKANAWLKTLETVFPNVHKGENLTGVYIPNAGAQFFLNAKPVGMVNDLELVKRFFSIWLSPQTSAPDLRLKLFGELN
jgi:hypothetical protein